MFPQPRGGGGVSETPLIAKSNKAKDFSVMETHIADLKIITPFSRGDSRGYFMKTFEKEIFAASGLEFEIFESFESFSSKNVVRGLHFQTSSPQSKLVRAIIGEVFDVAVDLRKNSPTFGRWHGEILSAQNLKMYYIPRGFAHGFLVISDTALVEYKCAGKYYAEYDNGIVWDDPYIGIDWPLANNTEAILSNRDKNLLSFQGFLNEYGALN